VLVSGHTGITLGIGWLLESTWRRKSSNAARRESIGNADLTQGVSGAGLLATLGGGIDYRLLLLGSMLPDIIDKPIGQVFFRDFFSNGRIFCHTLLFLILTTLAGLFLYRSKGKTWLVVLSFGTFTHLIFDQMWLAPGTLFWPLYGFAFEKIDLTQWVQGIFHALLTDPVVYIPEIVGGGILILFVWVVVNNEKLFAFIRNGKLHNP